MAEKRKKPTSAASTTGTTSKTRISFPLNAVTPTWNDSESSLGSLKSFVFPIQRGKKSETPSSSCAMPIVATVAISRGALKNRRRNRNSTRTPSRIALARPVPAARK